MAPRAAALPAALLAAGAAADCGHPASGPVTVGPCDAEYDKAEEWVVPSAGGAPGRITLSSDTSLCLDFVCDQDPCFSNGKYGPDAVAARCGDATPTFAAHANGTITVADARGRAPVAGTYYCIDLRSGYTVQLYPCVGSPNQRWGAANGTGRLVCGGGPSKGACAAACAAPPMPTPAPPSPFCPKYHPIRDGGVYDPSGPLFDEQSGVWHVWEDKGAWSHWTSTDLIHWNGSFGDSTHFGGDTGSVSPTPSGIYAFWPIMSGADKGAIGSAKALDKGLTQWDHRGATIPMPPRINTGYRDPVRAFEYHGRWFVGVGCGSKEEGAQFCLFEAADDTLSHFTDRGSLYTTNVTFGEVDGNIVWQPTNVSANMMECPDLFPLGDKWVLIGSLYKTNQWWVGTLSGDPPRFAPERVGILDYGNGYAAKTGSTFVQSGSTRRLNFGFTGWQEPTMVPGCGRALIMPRELSVSGDELVTTPIAETSVLRVPGSHLTATQHGGAVAAGAQVEVRLTCTIDTRLSSGNVGVRTLATADGAAYTEVGYDFAGQAFYVDHSKCCAKPNSIVQRAALPAAALHGPGGLRLLVWVDGGVIEAFLGGKVITPLVSPDPAAGGPADRQTTVVNTAGASCSVESWQLRY